MQRREKEEKKERLPQLSGSPGRVPRSSLSLSETDKDMGMSMNMDRTAIPKLTAPKNKCVPGIIPEARVGTVG